MQGEILRQMTPTVNKSQSASTSGLEVSTLVVAHRRQMISNMMSRALGKRLIDLLPAKSRGEHQEHIGGAAPQHCEFPLDWRH